MLLGQGGSEKRQKVVKASPATTSVTSALPHGFARVSPTTDEWKAVPVLYQEDHISVEFLPTGGTFAPRIKGTHEQLLNFTFFLFLAFWKVYQYMILESNDNCVKRVDDDVTNSAEVLPTQNQRRTRGNYRKIAARFSDTQTTAKQRSVLLTNVRNGDVNEEEYFHAVNSTFKKPLRCARSCDQLKFAKFDPDCSWHASTKSVATTSATKNSWSFATRYLRLVTFMCRKSRATSVHALVF